MYLHFHVYTSACVGVQVHVSTPDCMHTIISSLCIFLYKHDVLLEICPQYARNTATYMCFLCLLLPSPPTRPTRFCFCCVCTHRVKDMQTQIMLFWFCTLLNRKSCHRSLVVLIIVKSVYYDICIV